VYEPAPLLTTWRLVFANPASHDPAWMLSAGVPGAHSESFATSIWNVTLMPRAGALSARLNTTGTPTHGWAVETHRPLVFAATAEAGGDAKMLSV